MGHEEIGGSRARSVPVGLFVAFFWTLALVFAAPAQATFPGTNGKFVFTKTVANNTDIYVSNPDGTSLTRLTTDPAVDTGPSWSADGTKIVFSSGRDGNYEIYMMNADGSNQTNISHEPAPDYFPSLSPDGTKIAFQSHRIPNCCVPGWTNADVYTMNADGTNQTRITLDDRADDYGPEFSPNGQKIAYAKWDWYYDYSDDEWLRADPVWMLVNSDGTPDPRIGYGDDPNWSPDGTKIAFVDTDAWQSYAFIGVADVACCSSTSYATFFDIDPIWSPDGQKIAFASDGGTYTINPDGTDRALLNSDSYDGFDFDWQPLKPRGYARPISATPTTSALVPAYKPCASTNSSHGAPLSAPSCNPPVEQSTYVTTGHGDGHPAPANFNGRVTMTVVGESPINPNNGDQADIQLKATIKDVRNYSLTDYTGELRVLPTIRITDRYNGGQYSPPIHPATATDTPFGFTLSCATTAGGSIGSTCSATTTADAVMPDVVREGKRAVWELGQVKVYDGGADGDADTAGDNTLYAVQGLFAP